MKKLLVFDANSIINRAFYAVRPLTTRDNLHTNALFGFLNIVKKHLDAQAPDYAIAAFDLSAPTFRHLRYEGYKATRRPTPEELKEQMPYARDLASALGICVLEREGFEADDLLGTASAVAEQNGIESVLVTGDRDSLQLVSDKTTVMLCTTGADIAYTPAVFRENYEGLDPIRLVDLKAIAGDGSDNIPGVRGIGEKGALKLIGAWGTIENLYANESAWDFSDSLKQKLRESKENAFLSKELATICRTVPGLEDPELFRKKEIDRETLTRLFTKFEFVRQFSVFGLDRPPQDLPRATGEKAPPKQKPASEKGQVSLFASSDETENEPEQAKEYPALHSIGKGLYAVLIADGRLYASDAKETVFVPDERVCEFAASARVLTAGAKEYYHFVFDHGAPEQVSVEFDVLLAAYVYESASATLERACAAFLSTLLPPGAAIDKKLSCMLRLRPVLEETLAQSGALELYRTTELPLAKVLCKMERCGFLLDRAGLLSYGIRLKEKIDALEERIYTEAGARINLNSPKQLGELLYGKLGLPHARKTKTGYSTDAETLEKLRPLSQVVADLLEYRKLFKLYATYVEGLSRETDANGRVHTTFLQTQTLTGRLSSEKPNLQNIPVRTEEGRELRRFFRAPAGKVLVDADYSQVELRILAHLSGDEAFLKCFADGEDIHARTASEVFHVPLESVTREMRKDAKAINFGIVYGIGEYSLSQDLGVSRAVAAEYIKHYFLSYPRVKAFLEETVENARKNGSVSTLFGRRRVVAELSASNKQTVAFGERVAMNTPIQGTAADIMKRAMVAVDERLTRENYAAKLILQVHDELLIECPESEKESVCALLKEEMERAADLSVELTAEVGAGENWLLAK